MKGVQIHTKIYIIQIALLGILRVSSLFKYVQK